MKAYVVQITETRLTQILVKAKNEEEAYDKAKFLHETHEEIWNLLNDPNTCACVNIDVVDKTTPQEGEKIY